MTPTELEKPVPYPCDDSHTVAKISYQRVGIVPVEVAGMVPVVDAQAKPLMHNAYAHPHGRRPGNPDNAR